MLHCGDCLVVLPTLADASVDCVVTDPPYPHIKRSYGHWTEAEWFALMDRVVPECRRVLKPTGSAVFVLQPNSERAGKMRPWLWEFMAKWTRQWGMVQDAYWWRIDARPTAGAPDKGLLRQSVKACVWLGPADCYRNQEAVLWEESDANRAKRLSGRMRNETVSSPSHARPGTTPIGQNYKRMTDAAARRGGVTPFNVLPISNGNSVSSAGANGHGAGTPSSLVDWWIRYLCPPGGSVLDPFCGVGTVPLAALKLGRQCVGIEKEAEYVAIAERRLAAARAEAPLFPEAV
jgi:hypothetical protein